VAFRCRFSGSQTLSPRLERVPLVGTKLQAQEHYLRRAAALAT
jgi:hypothetical protein